MDVGAAGKIAGSSIPVPVTSKPLGQARAKEAEPAAATDTVQLSGAPETGKSIGSIAKKVAIVGAGVATGLVVAAAGAIAAGAITGIAAQLVISAMPQIQLSEGLVQALNLLMAGGIEGGKLLGAAAGAVTGGLIANASLHADKKFKPAESEVKEKGLAKNVAKYFKDKFKEAKEFINDAGSDLKIGMRELRDADSFGAAIKAGANTGALYGGAVGSVGGAMEGITVGFAIGTIAGLPVAAVTGKLPAVLPVSIMGAAAGSKVGSPIGSLAGSALGAVTGALGGAIYYVGKSIAGLFA
jgi:hypothetical protein